MCLKKYLLIIITLLATSSCAISKYNPIQTNTNDYKSKVDTLILRDSIYIDRTRIIKNKSDTVYITDTKTEYKYKTLYKVKVDTVYQDRLITKTKVIQKELTKSQQLQIKGFWVLISLILLFVIIKIIIKTKL